MSLTDQQIADYQNDGYLIIRDVLSKDEANDLRTNVQSLVHANELSFPASLQYPKPGKYTISGNNLAQPGLASVAEHPVVIDAVESLLGQKSYLTAYVAYLRSPGDKGGGAHNDYKRWRPVGSSMNWLFAIIPLTDFNKEYGPLEVSPGSHKLAQHTNLDGHIRDVVKPNREALADFVDPELKAGDLLLMNAHTWHNPPPGTTSEDRVGIFNKYCAIDAPPAAGYYPYNSTAHDAMSDHGKRLIPVCFDKPITTTRLLIEKESHYLLVQDENGKWELPGGEGSEEERVGWDIGARIGALQTVIKEQHNLDIPYMSFIDDVEENKGMCRIYGFTDETNLTEAFPDTNWFSSDQIQAINGHSDTITQTIATWHRDDLIRGKGKAIAQSKTQYE